MLPAPSTVLVLWAFHLTMSQSLFATLGADWWGLVQAIKQCNSVEEGHLPQLLNFLANFYINLHLDLGRLAVWAPCLLVLPVTTDCAHPPLLLWALLCIVPSLPAVEALDLVWVAVHKDQHFYWSMDAWDVLCSDWAFTLT